MTAKKGQPTPKRSEAQKARKLTGDDLDFVFGIGRVDVNGLMARIKGEKQHNEDDGAERKEPNRGAKRSWGLRKSAKAGARRRKAHAARRAG